MTRLLVCLSVVFGLATVAQAQEQDPPRVLLVVPSVDFWYPDYSETRAGFEAQGARVEVAAAQAGTCTGHQGRAIVADLGIADVDVSRYDAVAFVGGWGSSAYQFAFPGTYANANYQGSTALRAAVNDLIGRSLVADKPTGGICFGVSVLAWARVDGVSPLAGRNATTYPGNAPPAVLNGSAYTTVSARWHLEENGAVVPAPGSVGDPTTAADDVIVDGRIVTAQDWRSGAAFARAMLDLAAAETEQPAPEQPAPEQPEPEITSTLPVLMVIANHHFYWREYGETREELEAGGVRVVVAAATTNTARPHANTGYPSGTDGSVQPDLTLADVDPVDYSAIVFVGGWGSSAYQFAFPGTYANGHYNGSTVVRQRVNQLVGAFLADGKRVAAICHGVSVLAWARVGGVSPIAGRTVVSYPGNAPTERVGTFPNVQNVNRSTRWHIEQNGGVMLAANSVGDPTTADDDVVVDGQIVTAQDYDSARAFGRTLAELLQP